LAFDKATVIVKDDATAYSFDTAGIEHIPYPRDLRYAAIVKFKQDVTDKVRATYNRSISDKGYSTFLKHFGPITSVKLDTKEVSAQDFILAELKSVSARLEQIERINVFHIANLRQEIDRLSSSPIPGSMFGVGSAPGSGGALGYGSVANLAGLMRPP